MHRAVDRTQVLEPPLRIMASFTKDNQKARILLNQNSKMYFEGFFMGFDEYMNIVLHDAYEVYVKDGNKISLGTIMLRGDTIGLICPIFN